MFHHPFVYIPHHVGSDLLQQFMIQLHSTLSCSNIKYFVNCWNWAFCHSLIQSLCLCMHCWKHCNIKPDPSAHFKGFVIKMSNLWCEICYYFSDYDLDAWKRMYSNNDTIPVALPYFWDKFDKEGYSLWHCNYLYADDIGQSFMAANLCNGKYFVSKLKKQVWISLALAHAFIMVLILYKLLLS